MDKQVLKQNGFHLFLIKQEKMAKMVKTVNLLMKLLLETVIPEQRHNGSHLLLAKPEKQDKMVLTVNLRMNLL